MKPKFIHDCDQCKLIDQTPDHDWYHCFPSCLGQGTLIARYGNDGPEYWSSEISIIKSIKDNQGSMTLNLAKGIILRHSL